METGSFTILENDPPVGLGKPHISSFLAHLRTEGYAEKTLRNKNPSSPAGKQLTVNDLNESQSSTSGFAGGT